MTCPTVKTRYLINESKEQIKAVVKGQEMIF